MTTHECDVLVVGSGGAGLRAAVEAAQAGAKVLVAAKGIPGSCGTTYTAASDWMAFGAAFGHADPADAPREHWIDIMVKGGLVCKPELARAIAEDAPARLQELEDWAGASTRPRTASSCRYSATGRATRGPVAEARIPDRSSSACSWISAGA